MMTWRIHVEHWNRLENPDAYRDQANWIEAKSINGEKPCAWAIGCWMFTEYTVNGEPKYLLWHREAPTPDKHWLAYVDNNRRVVFDKASDVRAFVADREAAAARGAAA